MDRNQNNLGNKSWIFLGGLILWLIYVAIEMMKWQPVPMGESDDYIFATISLQYQHNLGIDKLDLEYAKRDFPEFAEYLQGCFDRGEQSEIIDEDTGRLPWYFGTYSLACIPIKVFLSLFDLKQILTFQITNYCLYLLAVFYSLTINGSDFKKLLTAGLIAINPIVFYIAWSSAEVFIFSFVVISIVNWVNRKYYSAALFVSIAGMMNSTIMCLGIFILLDYFYQLYKQEIKGQEKVNALGIIRKVVIIGVYFVPSIVPFLYYKFKYGVWNLQVSYGFAASSDDYLGRCLSYIFDWNYGIFPYFFIAFIAFCWSMIRCIQRKNYYALRFIGALFCTICAFSIMWHINCGMSGIARYCAWVSPILLVGLVEMLDFENKIRRTITILIIAIVSQGCIVLSYGTMFASKTSDIKMTPVAKLVIEKIPYAYFELGSSFIDRAAHIPGGYVYEEPVAYCSDKGIVTKILVKRGDESKVIKMLNLDEAEKNYIKEHFRNNVEQYYITLSPQMKIKLSPAYYLEMCSLIKDGVIDNNALFTTGQLMDNTFMLNSDEIIYGPYIDILPGEYHITIGGENLDSVDVRLTAESGEIDLGTTITSLEKGKNMVDIECEMIETMHNFEICIYSNTDNVSVCQVKLEPEQTK